MPFFDPSSMLRLFQIDHKNLFINKTNSYEFKNQSAIPFPSNCLSNVLQFNPTIAQEMDMKKDEMKKKGDMKNKRAKVK